MQHCTTVRFILSCDEWSIHERSHEFQPTSHFTIARVRTLKHCQEDTSKALETRITVPEMQKWFKKKKDICVWHDNLFAPYAKYREKQIIADGCDDTASEQAVMASRDWPQIETLAPTGIASLRTSTSVAQNRRILRKLSCYSKLPTFETILAIPLKTLSEGLPFIHLPLNASTRTTSSPQCEACKAGQAHCQISGSSWRGENAKNYGINWNCKEWRKTMNQALQDGAFTSECRTEIGWFQDCSLQSSD